MANLKRSANRAREALRPKHPKHLDFEVIRKIIKFISVLKITFWLECCLILDKSQLAGIYII